MRELKFNLNGNAFQIVKAENGFYLRNCNGFVMEYSQVKEVCEGLLNYAEKNKDKLNKYNKMTEKEFCEMLRKNNSQTNNKQTKSKGYVYLFKCNDRYKIGVSKDVNRRLKDLNGRPYEISLITKSKFIDNPYIEENKLHKEYQEFRLGGEWFNLDKHQVEIVKNKIESLR